MRWGIFRGCVDEKYPFPEKCAVLALPDARPLPETRAEIVRVTLLVPRALCGPAMSPTKQPVPGPRESGRFDPPLFPVWWFFGP